MVHQVIIYFIYQDNIFHPKEIIVFKKKKSIYNKFTYKNYTKKLHRLKKKYKDITKNF